MSSCRAANAPTARTALAAPWSAPRKPCHRASNCVASFTSVRGVAPSATASASQPPSFTGSGMAYPNGNRQSRISAIGAFTTPASAPGRKRIPNEFTLPRIGTGSLRVIDPTNTDSTPRLSAETIQSAQPSGSTSCQWMPSETVPRIHQIASTHFAIEAGGAASQ
ncbi:hypothetical protein OH491_01065 [Termitidicoccus mucosus]